MTRLPLVLALLVLTPGLAGCFAGQDAAPAQGAVAQSAAEAGALDGPAPVAAKDAYQVATEEGPAATAYPLRMETTAAKAPYTQRFQGEYAPQECLPTGGGLPLGGLGLASGGAWFDVADAFATRDVFSYDVTLTFTNTDQSWAELHLWFQFDQVGDYWTDPTSGGRGDVVLNFTGQGFITSEEIFARVGVDCWYGQVTAPIPFTIDVTVTFAEGAVPSAQPVLVEVPEGATRLFVSGLALEGGRPVTSHYRIFAPDDSLVCECALSSDQATAVAELPGPGEYVVLVDHTDGGFVALALDQPSVPLRPLSTRYEEFVVASSDGGAVDEVLQITLNSTPLNVGAWVFAPGPMDGAPDVGAGQNVKITMSNARGDVLRMSLVGYVTFHAAVPGMFVTNDWYAVPIDGDWEFYQDHHAYALGGHTITVTADHMRGWAGIMVAFYDRGSAAGDA